MHSPVAMPQPTSGRGGFRPPIAHLLEPGDTIRPGAVAYCGTRIRGVPAPANAENCTMCYAIRDERRGKI